MESTGWRFGLRRDDGLGGYAFRIATMCTAIAGVMFGSLGFLDLLSETDPSALTGQVALFLVLAVPPVLLGVLAVSAPSRLVRQIALGYGLLYLGVLAWAAVAGPERVDPHGEAWVISITSIPAASAMLAIPRPRTWVYIPALGVMSMLVAIRSASSDQPVLDGVIVGLYDATFSAFFVGMVFVALVWTQRLDDRIADEARAQAESSAAQARIRERQRFEALTHDAVISTLLVAARDSAPADTLAAQATSTLAQFAEPFDGEMSGLDFVDLLRADVVAEASQAAFLASDAGELRLSVTVVDALRGATLEAIRNAVRHAGAGRDDRGVVELTVRCELSAHAVSIEVSDSGRGFVPERISAARLGVRYSIIERMRAVGGDARIISAPGDGTRVVLEWRVG